MSSRRRKDEVRALADAEQRRAACARLRHPGDDVRYASAGWLRVQIVRVPSFERTVAWEVRELDEALLLFRSESPEPDQYMLRGHLRLEMPSETLRALVEPLHALVVPVFPRVDLFGIADGARIEVAVNVGFEMRLRATWPEDHAPIQWAPLEEIVGAMLRAFGPARPTEA